MMLATSVQAEQVADEFVEAMIGWYTTKVECDVWDYQCQLSQLHKEKAVGDYAQRFLAINRQPERGLNRVAQAWIEALKAHEAWVMAWHGKEKENQTQDEIRILIELLERNAHAWRRVAAELRSGVPELDVIVPVKPKP